MRENNTKQDELLPALAAHVLENGLNTASLRPLAKAAGTSDRMLIYHFGSKEGLMAALLAHLAQDLSRGLTAALPPVPLASRRDCVTKVIALMRAPQVAGYTRIWLDIISASGQGATQQRETGHGIIAFFLDWLEARVPDEEPDKRKAAMELLTLIEGVLVMDAVGQGEVADAAIAALPG